MVHQRARRYMLLLAVVAPRREVEVDEVVVAVVVGDEEGSAVLAQASRKVGGRSQHFGEAGAVHARQEGIVREQDGRKVHEVGMDQRMGGSRDAAVDDP